MAASNAVVPMVRVLAIIHIGVGAFLIIFGIFDAAVQHGTLIRFICLPVVFGLWVSFASLSKFRFRVALVPGSRAGLK